PLFQTARQRRAQDLLAPAPAALGKVRQVARVQTGEQRPNRLNQVPRFQEMAIAVRRDGEAVGDADAARRQFAIQFAEVGVLAADARNIAHAEVAKPADELRSHSESPREKSIGSTSSGPLASAVPRSNRPATKAVGVQTPLRDRA